MSSSSQSGQPQQPNSSPPRRLQTPEERFGTHPLYAVDPEPEAAPDPFVPLEEPAHSSSQASRSTKGRRPKTRHERQRFAREARHVPVRRATHSNSKTRDSKDDHIPPVEESPEGHVVPEVVASPTLERIRDGRRRFWKRLSTLTALLVVVGTGVAALFAPQMNIESVKITGLHATSPILVEPIAQRLLGHNVIRANKNAIAQSAERLPTIASAQVVLGAEIPPRVELRVVERKPIMRIGDGSSWWVADESGNPYRNANARDAGLPALTWNGPIQTMKPLDEEKWDDALQLVDAVQGNTGTDGGGLGRIHSMQLDANGDATLMLASPDGGPDLTLKLGNDQWSEKLARARMAMTYFARTKRQPAELNLIALKLPRWTPRGAVTADATPLPTEMRVPAT